MTNGRRRSDKKNKPNQSIDLCFALRFLHMLVNCIEFNSNMFRSVSLTCWSVCSIIENGIAVVLFFIHSISIESARVIALIVLIASFEIRVFNSTQNASHLRSRGRLAAYAAKPVCSFDAFHTYHKFYNKLSNRFWRCVLRLLLRSVFSVRCLHHFGSVLCFVAQHVIRTNQFMTHTWSD